jgi:hypothetical protein
MLNWKFYKFVSRCRIYKKHEYLEDLYLWFYCEWLKGKNGLWVVKSSGTYFVREKPWLSDVSANIAVAIFRVTVKLEPGETRWSSD